MGKLPVSIHIEALYAARNNAADAYNRGDMMKALYLAMDALIQGQIVTVGLLRDIRDDNRRHG
jgi:hypothetical protein